MNTIKDITDELIKMSFNNNDETIDRIVFIQNDRVKEIAHILYRKGGADLMAEVANNIDKAIKDNGEWYQGSDMRFLDCAWDGIGGWLC